MGSAAVVGEDCVWMTRVAACVGESIVANESVEAMPGTTAAAPAMSPRRSIVAARERCAALVGRSAGFFAMQLMTRLRTGSGTVPASSGGASLMCAIAMATCDSPVNGRRPARHSYATMPSE